MLKRYAVTRIRTGVAAATTQSTNHYTITARHLCVEGRDWVPRQEACLLPAWPETRFLHQRTFPYVIDQLLLVRKESPLLHAPLYGSFQYS